VDDESQPHRTANKTGQGAEGGMSADKIRELNDAFRKGERPELGRIMITAGIRELVSAWSLGAAGIYGVVQRFDAFDNDNNPHKENDFGSFEFAGEKVFWKIDYYDKSLEAGSEDPADEAKTTRVLTIMLASEY
jgi:hypothetical protein